MLSTLARVERVRIGNCDAMAPGTVLHWAGEEMTYDASQGLSKEGILPALVGSAPEPRTK